MSHPDFHWMRAEYLPLVNRLIASSHDPSVFEGFTHRERVLHLICRFDAETMNGGIDQYFWNPAGDQCYLCLEAFTEIQAPRARNYLLRAMSYFPNSAPAVDSEERQAQIETLWDDGTHLNDVLRYDVEPGLCALLRFFYEAQVIQVPEGEQVGGCDA